MQESIRKPGFSRLKPEQDKVRKAPKVSVAFCEPQRWADLLRDGWGGGMQPRAVKEAAAQSLGFVSLKTSGHVLLAQKTKARECEP